MQNIDSLISDQEKTEKIKKTVNRIIQVADPKKIILFGSLGRGEEGKNSDIDLLVVKEGDYHKGKVLEDIYMNLVGVGQAVDIVLVTPEEIEHYRNSKSLVIKPALDEGKIIYEREISRI
jgi:predicted nucleotidyltransferase